MRVSDVYKKAKKGELTCAVAIEILAKQPTADDTSHAHMHMVDGFRSDPTLIIENHSLLSMGEYRGERRRDWNRADTHLYPSAQSPLATFDPSNPVEVGQLRPGHVYMDRTRTAADGHYLTRTGLGEIPAVTREDISYYVKRLPENKKGAPADIPVAGPGDAPIPVGDTSLYVMEGPNRKIFQRRPVVTVLAPRVPASSVHTMFQDSEAMVMHFTAALLSDAGLEVLKTLIARGGGAKETVGIFSKTAVRAVERAIAKVAAKSGKAQSPTKMSVRTADTDPANVRNLTGTFTTAEADINHVVVVLGCSPTFELVVVTCVPTNVSTGDSIGTPTDPYQDIAEHQFGTHTVMRQTSPMPELKW